MSFIRPQASAAILRWREVLVGLAVLATGAWWAFGLRGPLAWIGWVVMLAGAALVFAGIQRARFRSTGRGPGIVRVTEGQIAYFGPLDGGAVALSEITRLSLLSDAKPAHWVLSQPGQPDLYIPLTAEGADALFDAFTSLPGIGTEKMLAAMRAPSRRLVVIWQRHRDDSRLIRLETR